MNQKDFEFCEYVEWNMCYMTYIDFCKKKKIIKRMYQDLDKYKKRFYKWYVYAHILADVPNSKKETYKNAIWEFLNSNDKRNITTLIKLKKSLQRNFDKKQTYDIIRTGDKNETKNRIRGHR